MNGRTPCLKLGATRGERRRALGFGRGAGKRSVVFFGGACPTRWIGEGPRPYKHIILIRRRRDGLRARTRPRRTRSWPRAHPRWTTVVAAAEKASVGRADASPRGPLDASPGPPAAQRRHGTELVPASSGLCHVVSGSAFFSSARDPHLGRVGILHTCRDAGARSPFLQRRWKPGSARLRGSVRTIAEKIGGADRRAL